jgi:hypothetical protein
MKEHTFDVDFSKPLVGLECNIHSMHLLVIGVALHITRLHICLEVALIMSQCQPQRQADRE